MKGNFLNHRLWKRLQTKSFEECKFQQCIHYTVWCIEIVFKPIPIFLFSREIKEGESRRGGWWKGGGTEEGRGRRNLAAVSIQRGIDRARREVYYNEIGFRLARFQAAFIKSEIPPFFRPTFLPAPPFFHSLSTSLSFFSSPTPFFPFFRHYSRPHSRIKVNGFFRTVFLHPFLPTPPPSFAGSWIYNGNSYYYPCLAFAFVRPQRLSSSVRICKEGRLRPIFTLFHPLKRRNRGKNISTASRGYSTVVITY